MRSSLAFACLSVFSFVSLALPVPARAAADAARILVEETKGAEVWVQRGGGDAKEALAKGAALALNDIVVTGDSSHAVIALLDGSKVSIGPFTQYQLLKAETDHGVLQWSFRLVVGTVRAIVRKAMGDTPLTRFKIHTDTGTAGVRGTDFVVAYNKEGERMDVYTLEGKVYVGPPGAEHDHADSQLVEKGRTRSIGKDGKPSKHRAFIRKEFLKTLEGRGFPEVSLGLDLSGPVAAKTGANGAAENTEKPAAADDATTISAKLFEMAAAGNTAAVKSLLLAGADPNYRGDSAATPLMVAAKGKHTLAMKALLDAKANPNAQDKRGHTALIYAVRWGDLEGVVLLRAVEADLDIKSAEGHGAEVYATKQGKQDISAFLKAWRAELENARKKNTKRKQ